MTARVAVLLAVLSMFLHLRAHYRGPRWQVYLFKPLTTGLLLVAALLAIRAHGQWYAIAVATGLACSLVGDVLLMLPGDRFTAGLGAFLLAHLAYLAAFTALAPVGNGPILLPPLVVAAGVLLRTIWAGLGRRRVPVLAYTFVVVLMVWTAWGWRVRAPAAGASLAATGATRFMISDTILALNRFRQPFRSAQALIMSTYVAAQAMISLSVGIA